MIDKIKSWWTAVRQNWRSRFPKKELPPEKRAKLTKVWGRFWLIVKLTVVAIALAFVIRGFLLIPVPVVGNSMENTLSQGDMVTMERISSVDRFDIIVFQEPDGRIYIKRVIGLPGESVSYQNDQLLIDGEIVAEDFLTNNQQGDTASNAPYTTNFTLEELTGSTTLGTNQYFVLGDNRRASKDSRSFGAVSGDNILGIVRLVYYPIQHFKWLH